MRGLPFWDHVEQLRKTVLRSGLAILIASLIAFSFHKELIQLLLSPLDFQKLYFFNPLEGFGTAVKLSFWAGIVFSSPAWIYFLLIFFLPALRKKERRLIVPFFLLSCVFIGAGIFFAYTLTLPFVMRFFYQFNAPLGDNLWSFGQTVDLIVWLTLAHGIVFELYVILLFLIKFKVLSYAQLKKMRKATIVAIFILAALLTPPDVLSQLLLAFPMLLLFESSLFYARLKQTSEISYNRLHLK